MELVARVGRMIIFEKIPQGAKNIAYLFVILKDVASFLPSRVYKIILGIVALSFAVKAVRNQRKRVTQERDGKEQAKISKEQAKISKEMQIQTVKDF